MRNGHAVHASSEISEGATQPISTPSSMAACSQATPVSGSPPPPVPMNVQPRTKSTSSLSVWIVVRAIGFSFV